MSAGGATRTQRLLGLWPLAASVFLLVVGYFPTKALAGSGGVAAMLAAQAMVLAVVYATLLPAMSKMVRAEPRHRFQVALAAAGVRFFVTLVLAVLMAWLSGLAPAPLLVWIGIAYVVMIQVETIALVRWMKKLENES